MASSEVIELKDIVSSGSVRVWAGDGQRETGQFKAKVVQVRDLLMFVDTLCKKTATHVTHVKYDIYYDDRDPPFHIFIGVTPSPIVRLADIEASIQAAFELGIGDVEWTVNCQPDHKDFRTGPPVWHTSRPRVGEREEREEQEGQVAVPEVPIAGKEDAEGIFFADNHGRLFVSEDVRVKKPRRSRRGRTKVGVCERGTFQTPLFEVEE